MKEKEEEEDDGRWERRGIVYNLKSKYEKSM
jgi:hypothetical protein